MIDHSVREHATWSASSTDRNWNCSGALALTMHLPETTSEAADWGTCAHQIAEKCLRDGVQALEFIGTTEKGKKYEFEVDDEMAETAQIYVDYVRKRAIEAAPKGGNPADLLQVEQRFSLKALNPPFDAGGTGDAVIYFPEEKMLEVVDLKGGRGVVVEVKGNPQLRTYGLGAMLANPSLKIHKIKVTIVQPRAPHKDGRIRSEEFHVADLVEWTTDLVAAMHRTAQALADYGGKGTPKAFVEKYGTSVMSDAEWRVSYLKAGGHCKFCKAAGFCPALEQQALDAAGVWFDDLDQPRLSNSPDTMSAEKLAQTLDMLDMIGDWCNAVRAYAHAQAEMGIEIPGYQLVEKIGNRSWKADVSPEDVAVILEAAGKDPGAAYSAPKPATPAQVEKILGAKNKSAIAELFERPVRGTNLVASAKTTREAAMPSVHKHFDILD